MQALYRDLQSQWEDLIVVTMTEFGRTSKENGSNGTDHAESSAMFVAGGGVKGGFTTVMIRPGKTMPCSVPGTDIWDDAQISELPLGKFSNDILEMTQP
jgi:hypothetical protein